MRSSGSPGAARIGAAVTKKTLILAASAALLVSACAKQEPVKVTTGAGKRFVPLVVDASTNVGVSPSIVMDADGNPFISYLGYQSNPKPGQIPEARPVTLPLVPAVLFANQQQDYWSVGGVSTQDDNLTQKQGETAQPLDNAATAAAVSSGGVLSVVWTDKNGLEYAADSNGTFTPETVAKGTGISGPSVAIFCDTSPLIFVVLSSV